MASPGGSGPGQALRGAGGRGAPGGRRDYWGGRGCGLGDGGGEGAIL